jgi:hypothetical protein
MKSDSPVPDAIYTAVEELLRSIYGGDVGSILLWTPPGSTKLDLASNIDGPELVRCLRDAANNIELHLAGKPIPPRR